MRIQPPIFAIVTPFDRRGRVDHAALAGYLGFLHPAGVRTIIVNGTTGEFASMTLAERKRVLVSCRASFDGCIVVNISACAARDSAGLLDHAAGCGADAVIMLPPFYFSNATHDGLVDFFKSVLGGSPLPALLYNFPRHTGVEITPGLFSALCAAVPPVVGIKDSGGDLEKSVALKSARPDRQVFVGSDTLALKSLERRLDGTVTGGGSAVLECVLGIASEFAAGRRAVAMRWQETLDRWTTFRKSGDASEIAVAKAGLAARIPGFPTYVRPPLSSPSPDVVRAAAELLRNTILLPLP